MRTAPQTTANGRTQTRRRTTNYRPRVCQFSRVRILAAFRLSGLSDVDAARAMGLPAKSAADFPAARELRQLLECSTSFCGPAVIVGSVRCLGCSGRIKQLPCVLCATTGRASVLTDYQPDRSCDGPTPKTVFSLSRDGRRLAAPFRFKTWHWGR